VGGGKDRGGRGYKDPVLLKRVITQALRPGQKRGQINLTFQQKRKKKKQTEEGEREDFTPSTRPWGKEKRSYLILLLRFGGGKRGEGTRGVKTKRPSTVLQRRQLPEREGGRRNTPTFAPMSRKGRALLLLLQRRGKNVADQQNLKGSPFFARRH